MELEEKMKEQEKIILDQQKTIMRQNEIVEKQQDIIIEQKNKIKNLEKKFEEKVTDKKSIKSSSNNVISKDSQIKRISELEQMLKDQEDQYEKNLKRVIQEKLIAVRKLQKLIEESNIKDWPKIVSEKDKIINEQEQKMSAVRLHVEKLKKEWAEKEAWIEKLEVDAKKFKDLEKSRKDILQTEEKMKKIEDVWKQKIKEKDNRIKELEKMLQK